MKVVIHHNPNCGTSRNTLEIIRKFVGEPVVVEYLNAGWTKPQLQALFAVAGLKPSDALRVSKSPAEELGLLEEGVSEDQLLDAMIEHPILVNRPIVCTSKGVKLCRPAEEVFELLDVESGSSFEKEDGEIVTAP